MAEGTADDEGMTHRANRERVEGWPVAGLFLSRDDLYNRPMRSGFKRPVMIMVAGPYRAGTSTAEQRMDNLRLLNEAALALHRIGHVPVIGVNMALPVIETAGGSAKDYDDIMMPISLALAERCDACLRIGGVSGGADAEAARFETRGCPVYQNISDVPPAR